MESPETVRTTIQPGELLADKYRVDRVIGEGGMGVVIAATNEALRQKVAIKLLRPGALENGEAMGRFKREAQAAASLKSQHVARVLDVMNLPDGRPMMVMEMLEGEDLGDYIERNGPATVATAVNFVLQACEAIAEAHAAGIVHRDLKPKNLFLTRTVDGRPLVKVLDFGISKIIEQAATNFSGMELTKTTEVIGSPSYMSPEQLRSARYVDARTDIWALGVILYELLTGRLPFYAHTVTELVLVVSMEQERPVHALRADIPPALSQVIAQCLAKDPNHRIQTVGELAAYIEPFASAFETSAAERVRAVAAGSGKTLPTGSGSSSAVTSGPSSSARIHVPGVHGGTSVAWGQTQMDPPRHSNGPPAAHVPGGSGSTRSSNSGAVVAVAVLGMLLVAGGIGGGALYWMKKANASTVTGVQPTASETVPLPPGRKDLPPVTSAAPPGTGVVIATAPEPSVVPSTLPSTRTSPPPAPKPPSTGGAPKPKPAAPNPPPDDLSNIGRR
jgi:eukaryotic-like serine/threonine-protein kinase